MNGLNGKPLLVRTTEPGMFTCWRCKANLPHAAFTPTALRNNGECKECRRVSNARYWTKYKAFLDETKAPNFPEYKAKEKKS